MRLIFIHGYSVNHTNTYGKLPEVLQEQARETHPELQLNVDHIYLGRYLSFYDEVTIEDVARAFDHAIRNQIPNNQDGKQPFSCITHSTGGPVARVWSDMYYGATRLNENPMRHLIMLAPANHGSALAQLGKGRLSRIKTWFQGVQPGQKILDWLELGSQQQATLHRDFLDYKLYDSENRHFPFVLTGQTIDSKLYDHLNSYTGEEGSDGVIRVAAANLNYRYLSLKQGDTPLKDRRGRETDVYPLLYNEESLRYSPEVPLGVIPGASHGGTRKGIQRSVNSRNKASKPVVHEILECLKVKTVEDYKKRGEELKKVTDHTQSNDLNRKKEKKDRYCMIVFGVYDDKQNPVTDFDMLLLAGKEYDEDVLPSGFFMDRQKNGVTPNRLVYYLNYDRMKAAKDKKMGMRIMSRPDEGFVVYRKGEFRSEEMPLEWILSPNEVIYVNIELSRVVDENLFRMDSVRNSPGTFKRTRVSGNNVQ